MSDIVKLFVARCVRLFSYGLLTVVLYLYLTELGFDAYRIGLLFTCTLAGDLVITLWLTVRADGFGRRNTLIVGAILKILAGVGFATVASFPILVFTAIIGVLTITGGEVGPFLAVEQASLTELISKEQLPSVFAWYNLCGYLAQATGALGGGFLVSYVVSLGYTPLLAYRLVVIGYGLLGTVMLFIYLILSEKVEPAGSLVRERGVSAHWSSRFGLHRSASRLVVFKLSCLFIIDAFAGGFVLQTLIVYYFHEKYNTSEDKLGLLLMGANVLSGLSALVAAPLTKRYGAIKTMVFSHLPSNIFLILVVCMPNEFWAVAMLMLRFSISQMDVPARQAYVAMVVEADERSAAGGITNIVRSVGLFLAPTCTGFLLAAPADSVLFASPFIIAGSLKIIYDVLLYISFATASQPAHLSVNAASHGLAHQDPGKDERDTRSATEQTSLLRKEQTFSV